MNNEVRNWRGEVVGFRCFECGNIYESGWGEKCNNCRTAERRHREIIEAIKSGKTK